MMMWRPWRTRRDDTPRHRMSDGRGQEIKDILLRHPEWRRIEARAARHQGLSPRAYAAATCIVLLAIGVIAFTALRQPLIQLEAATLPEGAIERLAHAVHEQGARDAGRPHVVSSSRDDVVRWVRQHAGLSVSLAERSGSADSKAFALEGASVAEEGALRAGVVSYRIDGRRVTLLTAHERFVPETVRWSATNKRIQYRADAATGETMMSWANSGQAYVLVSALPGMGQRSCLICHADGRRDTVIASLGR